jgi:prepilin-type N-terminal cleavage/methylation domain-containing protein
MESFRPYRGFTLIELVVVLAIMGVLMAVVITSQTTFNNTLLLEDTEYDVALTIHAAETDGIGSRVNGGVTNAGYGVDLSSSNKSTFTLFTDSYPSTTSGSLSLCHPVADETAPDAQPGNCVYDSTHSEAVMTYTLGNADTISNFCAYTPNTSAWSCANSSGSQKLTKMDIVFARPNAVPFISTNGIYTSSNPISQACLTISSAQGISRYIYIYNSGEIAADAISCP